MTSILHNHTTTQGTCSIVCHGSSLQVAYAWAMHLEVEEKKGPAARLAVLRKMGLVDYAIDYAAESGDFENAFALAEASKSTTKLPEIHLKHAMHLEVRNSLRFAW